MVVNELSLPEPKSRLVAEMMNTIVGQASVLVLMPEKDQQYEIFIRSADNVADTKVMLAGYLNIRDLLGYDKLILSLKTLDVLAAHLG